jgi:membrane protease subunit HflK
MGRANLSLIDVKGGNNVFYLPLDKMRRLSESSSAAGDEERASPVQESNDMPSKSVRPSVRGREGRGQP